MFQRGAIAPGVLKQAADDPGELRDGHGEAESKHRGALKIDGKGGQTRTYRKHSHRLPASRVPAPSKNLPAR